MLCSIIYMTYILYSIMQLLLLPFKIHYKLYNMVTVCCSVQVLYCIQNRPLQQAVGCYLNYLKFGVGACMLWEGLLNKMCCSCGWSDTSILSGKEFSVFVAFSLGYFGGENAWKHELNGCLTSPHRYSWNCWWYLWIWSCCKNLIPPERLLELCGVQKDLLKFYRPPLNVCWGKSCVGISTAAGFAVPTHVGSLVCGCGTHFPVQHFLGR